MYILYAELGEVNVMQIARIRLEKNIKLLHLQLVVFNSLR